MPEMDFGRLMEEVERVTSGCTLRLGGHRGCTRHNCACGNEPYMAIMIETDGQTVGVVIDNVNKADKIIANFVCIREKLWGTIS